MQWRRSLGFLPREEGMKWIGKATEVALTSASPLPEDCSGKTAATAVYRVSKRPGSKHQGARGPMENEERPERSEPQQLARRAFMTATIALGGLSLPMRMANAGTADAPIGWVHGSGATIAGARSLESDAIQGNARVVRGRSWSSLPLHFAIPTLSLDTGRPTKIRAIWLRLQTGSGARIGSVALHDCEKTVAHVDGLSLQRTHWGDLRIPLAAPQRIARGIGVTIGCEFDAIDRQVAISAVGCEFV
jgi:hypothetical protein